MKTSAIVRSKAQIAAGQRRSLASISKKVLAMALEWDEYDNGNMWELEELSKSVTQASKCLCTDEIEGDK